MSTNYNLKKALYDFLDVKLNSDNQITIANGSKFKMIKVEPNSIVNIFISAEQASGSATSIYINALGSGVVNEYYSDFEIKVYWENTDTIYIENNDLSLDINSVFIEFLKGKLLESYLVSNTDIVSNLKITVDSNNKNRINYSNESLTFKSEYDLLVTDFTSLNDNYDNWKPTLGLFSQVDKLISDSGTESGKNKKISTFISNSSIHSDLLIDASVLRAKLDSGVTDSLDLADTAVQSVTLNGGANLKDISENVSINALTKLKIEDYNATVVNLGIPVYQEYNVNTSGEIIVDNWSNYMQSKLLGVSGDLLYFNGTDTLSNIDSALFLLKTDIITDWGTDDANVNDINVASSLLTKGTLDTKVDKINRTSLNDVSLIKLSVSDQGLVTGNTSVSQSDLTTIINDYYLTVSYTFNSGTGELKLL